MTERRRSSNQDMFYWREGGTIIRTREKHELTAALRILQRTSSFEECTFGILTERIIMRAVEDKEIRGVDSNFLF